MIPHNLACLNNDDLLLISIAAVIAAALIGAVTGWALRGAENDADKDHTAGLMTPPEKESDWPGVDIDRAHRAIVAKPGEKPHAIRVRKP